MEGALAVQMACTHAATMSVLARFRGGGGSEHRVVALATAAARLMRAYSCRWRPFAASATAETSMSASSTSTSMTAGRRNRKCEDSWVGRRGARTYVDAPCQRPAKRGRRIDGSPEHTARKAAGAESLSARQIP
jgi:hypothetical protein